MRALTNPRLTDQLIDRLVEIWVDVTNAGGAVGFTPTVDADTVAVAVGGSWDRVLDGDADLVVVVNDDDRPVGFGFLVLTQDRLVSPHRAEIQKVMRDPAYGDSGVGDAVMRALEARAGERGLSLLTLHVRGGTDREGFYASHGFRVVATLPGWLNVDGRATDLIVMDKFLGGGATAARAAGRHEEAPMHSSIPMAITRLDHELPLPAYARPGDAGLDLMARERRVLPPGTRCLMPTGMAVAVPPGHVGLVHPRSGLAVRQGLSIVNSPGTIDSGYRGELMVPLINLDPSATIRIARGDRIAQLLIQPVVRVELREVDELPDGIRGTAGFGSTGS